MDILPQIIANSIVAGSIYMILALGFNAYYTVTNFINAAYGGYAIVGGYVTFFFGKVLGWNIAVSIMVGILGAVIIGYVAEKAVFYRLRKRKAPTLVLFLASLGMYIMIQSILSMLFGSTFQSLPRSDWMSNQVGVQNGAVTSIQAVIVVIAVVLCIASVVVMKYTRFGKSVRAISDDGEVASIVGVHVDRIIITLSVISAALGGLAGIVTGFDLGFYPPMGLWFLVNGVVASIVGGVGNIYGSPAGALIFAGVENFGIWKIGGEWKVAIAFGLLVIFLLFRPQGVLKK